MIPADTHPAVYARQVEVWRRLGPAGRIRVAMALSEALRQTARDQLRQAHPDWTPFELRMGFIQRVYGEDLARRARDAVLAAKAARDAAGP